MQQILLVTTSLCMALSRLDGASGQGVLRAAGVPLKGSLKNRYRGRSSSAA